MTHVPETTQPEALETPPLRESIRKPVARPLKPRKIIYVAGNVTIPADVLYRRLRWITAGFILFIVSAVMMVLLADRSGRPGSSPVANTAVILPSVTSVPISTPTPLTVTVGPSRVRLQDVNLRSRPGPEQPQVTILFRGTSVDVLGDAQQLNGSIWVHVRTQGREGWANQRYIFPVEDYTSDSRPRARIIGVTPYTLRIRSLPSKDGSVQGQLSEGSEAAMVESRDVDGITWWLIEVDDLKGWASGVYLKRIP